MGVATTAGEVHGGAPREADTARLFGQLKAEILECGLMTPDGFGSVFRLALGGPALAAIVVVAWQSDSILLCCVATFVASIMQAQFSFLGHDACHGSAAGSRPLNEFVGHASMGVIGGLCFEEWRSRHLQHHRHCQDERRDPDMQFATLFSLSEESVLEKRGIGRALAPYQAYYFWPSALLFAHSLRVCALAAAVRDIGRYRRDVLAVAAHFILWVVVPLVMHVAPLRVGIVYLACSSLLGIRLALVFTTNHVGMPLGDKTHTFLERQVRTSRNVVNPRWLDWFFGGLNFQIEHHLFPACSRINLRRVGHLVRPVVEGMGLVHKRRSLPQAIMDVTRHLSTVARTSTREA